MKKSRLNTPALRLFAALFWILLIAWILVLIGSADTTSSVPTFLFGACVLTWSFSYGYRFFWSRLVGWIKHGSTSGAPPEASLDEEGVIDVKAKKPVVAGGGGWLLLLTSSLLVFGPILSLGSISSGFYKLEADRPLLAKFPAWISYKNDIWSCAYFFIAASIMAGLLLCLRRDKVVPKIVVAVLWVIGPLNVVIQGYVILPSHFPGTYASAEDLGSMLGTFLICVLWTWYLLVSRRVRATYKI